MALAESESPSGDIRVDELGRSGFKLHRKDQVVDPQASPATLNVKLSPTRPHVAINAVTQPECADSGRTELRHFRLGRGPLEGGQMLNVKGVFSVPLKVFNAGFHDGLTRGEPFADPPFRQISLGSHHMSGETTEVIMIGVIA